MGTKSYATVISNAQVMLGGIQANEASLSKRGIDKAFAGNLQADIDACITLNNEQETLKAQLKEKTDELGKRLASLEKQAGEARKIIKLDIPQALWREFGINDKR
ncbi:MAG: hypothetical protein LBS42_12070 [Tannerella sp.]|jgi:hypothetical protein|nr:hypothetical protein [Tannerella sp.]